MPADDSCIDSIAPRHRQAHLPNIPPAYNNEMTETNSQAQWFSDNEQNWDDRAELHMAGNYCDYQRLLEDPTAISAELAQDIERFGDLTGKDVIHLQCHVGTDMIGFACRRLLTQQTTSGITPSDRSSPLSSTRG